MDDLKARAEQLRLVLNPEQLQRVRGALLQRMLEGLAAEGREVAMLPTFVSPPPEGLAGVALAVDAGGTNLRAALVRVDGDRGAELVSDLAESPLPGAAGSEPAGAEQFFAAHQRLVGGLVDGDNTPLGYCFSYPSTCQPDGDAVLIKWTKEVRVAAVAGCAVGKLLRDHLAVRGTHLGRIVVLNDTIAALMAGANQPRVDPARAVGVIAGTGSNAGAFVPIARIDKLGLPGDTGSMAVNFECGNFRVPVRGPVDQAVDETSTKKGHQWLEKMISGAYLGRLYVEACRQLSLTPPHGARETRVVSELAASADTAGEATLARLVIRRAADLVAAMMAATHDLLGGHGPLCICAEGSVFEKAPNFKQNLGQTLDALVPGVSHRIVTSNHANLVGSALAALEKRSDH